MRSLGYDWLIFATRLGRRIVQFVARNVWDLSHRGSDLLHLSGRNSTRGPPGRKVTRRGCTLKRRVRAQRRSVLPFRPMTSFLLGTERVLVTFLLREPVLEMGWGAFLFANDQFSPMELRIRNATRWKLRGHPCYENNLAK